MENIIFAAEDLFGHVLEAENGVLLISCFDGTFTDKKSRYMTVIGKEVEGSATFLSERMNLDLGEAVADFYRRSGASTNYTPLNNISALLPQSSPRYKELVRKPISDSSDVCYFPLNASSKNEQAS